MNIQFPSQQMQTPLNLERWAKVLSDPSLNRIEGRVEMDRHGRLVLIPPETAQHGFFQAAIAHLLHANLTHGRVIIECPVSTADGVRAADASWASRGTLAKLGDNECFPVAPEICVEVISPRNSQKEMEEKMALYFDAGAQEVWFCSSDGGMSFYVAPGKADEASRLCPNFPKKVQMGAA